MPPRYVRTIREELFYEYAKLISRSVFDGQINYRFVADRFKALRDGSITISGTMREWQREQELPKCCVFCQSAEDLQTDHLIPRSRGGRDDADNIVWSCRACNAARADQGIFQWLGLKKKDHLHRLVAGKYLKQLFDIHSARGTLEIDRNRIEELCPSCRNKQCCTQWGTVGKLTCLCLESVF